MTDSSRLWTGRILSALAVIFLVFDGSVKVMRLPMVLEASAQLGFPPGGIVLTGIVLLACTLLYAIPPTSIVGAVLLTGYLGGAVAAQMRVGNPLFETVFPIIVGSVIWAGILARDQRARAILISR